MNQTKLKKYRVRNFRSVEDSGWIEVSNVNCLVGTNESGKTNVLAALWKLNPANNEPILPLIDYPRKKYHTYHTTKGEEIFVTAVFELSDHVSNGLASQSGWDKDIVRHVVVSRRYNGQHEVSFLKNKLESLNSNRIVDLLNKLNKEFKTSVLQSKEESEDVEKIQEFINKLAEKPEEDKEIGVEEIIALKKEITTFLEENYKRKVNINSFFKDCILNELDRIILGFEENGISVDKGVKKIILEHLPTFVYYSDYGNLDSEIYLPHVIDNFQREDLGERERAKVRSLKVLFDFVSLSPTEILDLGKEALPIKVVTKNHIGQVESVDIEQPEEIDVETEREKKKEREVLLQSASTSLTRDFKDWWKQGNYKFRFQADGNHFRIWVSDDKRTEEIELEGRSRGLQWFFSFFLVFLVESQDAHANCVLLLDEPGLSLHPIAQFDLTTFFNSLSTKNQLIYTTHSPFLVNPDNLSGVYTMYIGDSGESIVSADLRGNEKIAEKSIYPIHAAIGITVSETLLLGCQPVLVEGVSDQIYLQLIKRYVISEGKFRNKTELVFIPSGGVRGMSPIIKILLGRENNLPFVLLDSDTPGKEKSSQLCHGLYKDENDKILTVADFLGDGDFEIEDLVSKDDLARIFAKNYRRTTSEDEFDYLYDQSKPIVPQMEEFALNNGYELKLGWKVEIAKEFQRNYERIISRTSTELKDTYLKLIDKLTS